MDPFRCFSRGLHHPRRLFAIVVIVIVVVEQVCALLVFGVAVQGRVDQPPRSGLLLMGLHVQKPDEAVRVAPAWQPSRGKRARWKLHGQSPHTPPLLG